MSGQLKGMTLAGRLARRVAWLPCKRLRHLLLAPLFCSAPAAACFLTRSTVRAAAGQAAASCGPPWHTRLLNPLIDTS